MSEQRLDPDFITRAAQRLISRDDAVELVGAGSESAAFADELYQEAIKDASPEIVQAVAARAEEIRAKSEVAEARRREELAARRETIEPVSDEEAEEILERVKDPSERAVLDDMLGRHRYNRTREISPIVQEMVSGAVSTEPAEEEPYYPSYKKGDGAFGGSKLTISKSNNPFDSHRVASKPPNKSKPEGEQ